jgi:hypothetical protein
MIGDDGAAASQYQAFELMALDPFAPKRRLNVDVLSIRSIDPSGPVLVTWESDRVDQSIIVQHADFEISVKWRD